VSAVIYLIQSGEDGPVKIGITSSDPRKRVAQLQTGNPTPLRLRATISGDASIERHLHSKFGQLRLNGEWFEPDAAIFAAFAAAQNWPHDPVTLPPVTPGGIKFLRDCLDDLTIRPVYPDGRVHRQIDWDDLDAQCVAAAASYDTWAKEQGIS
jgi:hypothetical protein